MKFVSNFVPIEHFVLSANEAIYEEVITLDEHLRWVNQKEAIIYAPAGNLQPRGFIHELLHVYLDLKNIEV